MRRKGLTQTIITNSLVGLCRRRLKSAAVDFGAHETYIAQTCHIASLKLSSRLFGLQPDGKPARP